MQYDKNYWVWVDYGLQDGEDVRKTVPFCPTHLDILQYDETELMITKFKQLYNKYDDANNNISEYETKTDRLGQELARSSTLITNNIELEDSVDELYQTLVKISNDYSNDLTTYVDIRRNYINALYAVCACNNNIKGLSMRTDVDTYMNYENRLTGANTRLDEAIINMRNWINK